MNNITAWTDFLPHLHQLLIVGTKLETIKINLIK